MKKATILFVLLTMLAPKQTQAGENSATWLVIAAIVVAAGSYGTHSWYTQKQEAQPEIPKTNNRSETDLEKEVRDINQPNEDLEEKFKKTIEEGLKAKKEKEELKNPLNTELQDKSSEESPAIKNEKKTFFDRIKQEIKEYKINIDDHVFPN